MTDAELEALVTAVCIANGYNPKRLITEADMPQARENVYNMVL
jgi:hypothetical protein